MSKFAYLPNKYHPNKIDSIAGITIMDFDLPNKYYVTASQENGYLGWDIQLYNSKNEMILLMGRNVSSEYLETYVTAAFDYARMV
jgi:hypothetical protein